MRYSLANSMVSIHLKIHLNSIESRTNHLKISQYALHMENLMYMYFKFNSQIF